MNQGEERRSEWHKKYILILGLKMFLNFDSTKEKKRVYVMIIRMI